LYPLLLKGDGRDLRAVTAVFFDEDQPEAALSLYEVYCHHPDSELLRVNRTWGEIELTED
jgi:hypothetical protein